MTNPYFILTLLFVIPFYILPHKPVTGKEGQGYGTLHSLLDLAKLSALEEQISMTLKVRHLQLNKQKIDIKRRLRTIHNTIFSVIQLYWSIQRFFHESRSLISEQISHLISFSDKSVFVSADEFFMSINSILHIHEVYGLRHTHGFDLDSIHGGQLKVVQCLEVGMFALSRESYYRSVEWMDFISDSNRIQLDGYSNLWSMDLSRNCHLLAIQEHNRKIHSSRTQAQEYIYFSNLELNLYDGPILLDASEKTTFPVYFSSGGYPIKYTIKHWDNTSHNYEHIKLTHMCKGNSVSSPETQKSLKCYLKQYQNPYLFINPVKMEVLSENPPVYQYFQVVGNKTIEYIKAFRTSLIDPAILYGKFPVYNSFEERSSTYAIQKMQMHLLKNIPTFGVISESMTGLKFMDTTELLVWSEYIYGRYRAIHTDTRGDNPIDFEDLLSFQSNGHSLAILMYYIETPVLGGYTPFIQPGISAPPEKGSLVVWFNAYRNGSKRTDVDHAGCPVLHGNKIVLITPVWYNGNWKDFKCSLYPAD